MGDANTSPDILMSIIVPYVLPYLLPIAVAVAMYIYSHLPAQKQAKALAEFQYIRGLAEVVVRAVEQTNPLASGPAKRAKADGMLKQLLGMADIPTGVSAAIEAAVQQLPATAGVAAGVVSLSQTPQDVTQPGA